MLGRILLTLSALAQVVGPFIADFNETHVLNPHWPPHARFHNGQTMSLGLYLGLATLYYTYRNPKPRAGKDRMHEDDIFTAAIFGSAYWLCGLSAIFYPGSKGVDPEFGEGFPQGWLFGGYTVGTWVGWWVETRMGRREGVEKRG